MPIQINSKISTPNDKRYIKEFINQKYNTKTYSFFYNIYEENENKEKKITERYVIYCSNMQITPNQKLNVDAIKRVKSVSMKSNNGETYLNVEINVELSVAQNQSKNNGNGNYYKKNQNNATASQNQPNQVNIVDNSNSYQNSYDPYNEDFPF